MDNDLYPSTDRRLVRLRRRLWLERLFFVGLLAVAAAHNWGLLPGGRQTWLIAVDGRPIAVVAERGDASRLLEQIKENAGLGDEVTFAEKVSLNSVPADRNPAQSETEAMKALVPQLHVVVDATAIIANGDLVLGLPSKSEAARTLSLLREELSPPGPSISAIFKENIRLEARKVSVDRFAQSAEAAVEKIKEESAPVGTYEVMPGDSAWKIARDHKVSLSRLAHSNPELNMERIRAGDKVVLPGKGAPLTVLVRKEVSEMSGGGTRRQTRIVRVTYENGVEVNREMIGSRRTDARD